MKGSSGGTYKILIFGCGSLGANTCINIARKWSSSVEFVLVDFDDIARVNLANQPWFDVNVGQRKATVLTSHVYRVTGAVSVPIVRKVESSENFVMEYGRDVLSGVSLFVDCFDNVPSRVLTNEIATFYKKPILHAGFSETVFRAAWDRDFDLSSGPVRAPVCDRRDLATLVVLGAGITEFIVSKFVESKGTKKFSKILEINNDTLSLW